MPVVSLTCLTLLLLEEGFVFLLLLSSSLLLGLFGLGAGESGRVLHPFWLELFLGLPELWVVL